MNRWYFVLPVVLLVTAISYGSCLSEQKTGDREMKVARVDVDPLEGKSVIFLQDTKEEKVILIWIGVSEANAIYLEIHGVVPPRPMTHDLIKNILDGVHARVHHILIHDVRQNVIYARIILTLNGKEISVDARPSDAIAVAVRVKAPIFVTDEIYRTLSIDLKQEEEKGSDLSV